jgi:hypothetical protein
MERFELTLLEGTPSLQGLEKLLDRPASAIGVDDAFDLFCGRDRFGCYDEP